MKKIISCILCAVFVLAACCGCDKPDTEIKEIVENVISDVQSNVADIVDIADIIANSGKNDIPEYQIKEPAVIDTSEKMLCYNALNKDMQKIYAVLLSAIKDMTSGWIKIPIVTKNYKADIASAIYAIEDDHPEIFWIGSNHLIKEITVSGKKQLLIAFDAEADGISCHYLFSKSQVEQMSKELEQTVTAVIEPTANMRNFEKELYFNDYICKNVEYTEGESELSFTSYGALVGGKAVCSGYAKAMQMLCSRVGIENVLCHGTAENESHVWNEIKLDNEWYHTDVTWNDGDKENIILYRYFNITDEKIKKDHKISPLYSAVSSKDIKEDTALNCFDIKATGEKYNYYEYYFLKLVDSHYKQLANAIIKDIESGRTYTQFAVYDEVQLSGFENGGKSFAKLQRALNAASFFRIKPPKIEKYSVVDNIVLLFW